MSTDFYVSLITKHKFSNCSIARIVQVTKRFDMITSKVPIRESVATPGIGRIPYENQMYLLEYHLRTLWDSILHKTEYRHWV